MPLQTSTGACFAASGFRCCCCRCGLHQQCGVWSPSTSTWASAPPSLSTRRRRYYRCRCQVQGFLPGIGIGIGCVVWTWLSWSSLFQTLHHCLSPFAGSSDWTCCFDLSGWLCWPCWPCWPCLHCLPGLYHSRWCCCCWCYSYSRLGGGDGLYSASNVGLGRGHHQPRCR